MRNILAMMQHSQSIINLIRRRTSKITPQSRNHLKESQVKQQRANAIQKLFEYVRNNL